MAPRVDILSIQLRVSTPTETIETSSDRDKGGGISQGLDLILVYISVVTTTTLSYLMSSHSEKLYRASLVLGLTGTTSSIGSGL